MDPASPDRAVRPPRALLIALAVVFASATLLYSALWLIAAHATGVRPAVELGFDVEYVAQDRVLRVNSVVKGAPAERAGIRPGDRVLALDGSPLLDASVQPLVWSRHAPGDTVVVEFLRDPGARRMTVRAVFRARLSAGAGERIAVEALDLFLVPFVLVGLTVLFLRVDSGVAWLLALMLVSFGSIPGPPDTFSRVPLAGRFAVAYQAIVVSVVGPLFYWFFALFPRRSPVDERAPWLKWAGVAGGLSLAATEALTTGTLMLPPPLAGWVGHSVAIRVPFWYEIAFMVLGLVSLAWNRIRLRDTDSLRRIRLIFWGTVIGVTPSLVRVSAGQLGFRGSLWLDATVNVFLLALFPLSFAYAILHDRALDIPVLLRRGARYLLVLRGSVIVLVLACVALTAWFAAWMTHWLPSAHRGGIPIGIALGAAFGGTLLWSGARIQQVVRVRIDRAFFRSAYDARLILEDLARRTARATGRDELARLLEEHVQCALQPGGLCVFLGDANGGLRGVGSACAGAALAPDTPLLAALAERGHPWELPAQHDPLPAPLAAIGPECLAPMLGRDAALVGLLALGPRRSEEPYSREDLRLLASVAGQAGLALDNIRLGERIAEHLETERRAARELAIARDVQNRLLPQSLPQLETLEVAARCIQARSVGGDLYDVIDLGEGRIALALADVSGKGMHAALLMAGLQAHLRGQLGLTPDDPARCLERVNQLLCKATDPGHFATLFLGIYHDQTRELTYVNCGHNPPAWLRSDGRMEWLPATATVVGAFEDWTCETGTARVVPGDVLAIYSDGLTEAMRGNEQFGDARLAALLTEQADCSADCIVSGLLRQVQEFGDAGSSDDLTLLVAKVR